VTFLPGRFVFDGRPVPFREGESIAVALLRAGLRPAGGGCLCLAGDCPYCFATVDGVSYSRTCLVPARAGMVVERHPANGSPVVGRVHAETPALPVRHLHCDVVVIGMGPAGTAAAAEARARGLRTVTLDTAQGQAVVGLYPGPLVVARTAEGLLHAHPAEEIVAATGAAEIQPVAPGNDLDGLVTRRAAAALAAAGVDLGRVVALGEAPDGVACEPAAGELVRFEGENRVSAVVVADAAGHERRLECDTVSVGLGLQPRTTLARMGNGLPVRSIGDAALAEQLPPPPREGIVCPCSAVTVADLESVWERGFHELELFKRATLAGTGACQGSVCTPHVRSFLASRGKALQAPFTARPVTWPVTIAEAAAGAHHDAAARTALDSVHRSLGARMERAGGWWRPWHYGYPAREYWAVREGVSLCDVSTLGKMLVSGPDALELLERLYPTKVATLRPGRSRYVLLLDERGYVKDDGMICRDGETRFMLTFTSGGSTHAELWVRDWAESWRLDVRLMNRTVSVGAINVTGPLATELLRRAGLENPPAFLQHGPGLVAGIACRVCRLSFTGEVSYELHHRAADSVALWGRLMELGAPLGVRPHGLGTLLDLRLEKGHILVGQDTDFDSTPRRLGHEWAVRLDKPDFIGRDSVVRTDKVPLDRRLAGFETDGTPPPEGASIWHGGEYAGYVTSSAFSPVLRKGVMLGWLKLFGGELPADVVIGDRPARRVPVPFYDPEGARARA
jgi:glycine cleavage system aminomethyltransferase T